MPSAIELIVNSVYLRNLLEAEEGENLTLEELSAKLDALGPLADFADIATALTALGETSALYDRITDIKNILYNEVGQPLWTISDQMDQTIQQLSRIADGVRLNGICPDANVYEYTFANGNPQDFSFFSFGDNSGDDATDTEELIVQLQADTAGNDMLAGFFIDLSGNLTTVLPGDRLAFSFQRKSGSNDFFARARIDTNSSSENFENDLVVADGDTHEVSVTIPAGPPRAANFIYMLFGYDDAPNTNAQQYSLLGATISMLAGVLP